jgi:quercetin 2,3-dioxygenase
MNTSSNASSGIRSLQRVIAAMATSDGAGVRLRRSLGQGPDARLDPFLMLDEFSSENPDDYVAGFPSHPHRGFETVTYMLDGHMLHEDHLGNRGDLKSGGVQWMTAGRGIIHSEMPQQEQGRMRGFQLWINLPADEKMKPAAYRDIQPPEIPVHRFESGGQAKVIAGTLQADGKTITGPIQGLTTDALYLDIELPPGARFAHAIDAGHHAYVYPFEGSVLIDPDNTARPLKVHHGGVLSPGERIEIAAGGEGARFLLLAGKPLREPIAQYGPFVMNTPDQIQQAIIDFQNGRLTQ